MAARTLHRHSNFEAVLAPRVILIGVIAAIPTCTAPVKPFVVLDNAGWCWFQDERAIIRDGKIITGGVAGDDRAGMSSGDVIAVTFDPSKGRREIVLLHEKLDRNDHAAPSFIEVPGGVIAAYSSHHRDGLTRWRRLSAAGVSSEGVFESREPVTYTNLLRTCAAGACRLWNFIRSEGWDPNFLVSDDNGTNWRYGGRLLEGPGRPYVKYTSDGEQIHFAASDQHPRDFGTSIYYGTISTDDGSPATNPTHLERVFAGDNNHRAWPIDIELRRDGEPQILFSVQKRPGRTNLYFFASRQKSGQWSVSQVAFAGSSLYPAESEYTGLGAIDPNVENRLIISANVDPANGARLQHYELFEGRSTGGRWSWISVTAESIADNLRPTIIRGQINGRSVLLWERGEYRTFTDYSTEIVGAFLE